MKIDPQLMTGIGPPTRPTPSKHRWRDIGGGKIKCDNTKRVMSVHRARSVPEPHTITLTAAEWAKLEALAAHRSTLKHTCTPQECVRDFIKACHTEDTWEHPLTTAARHRGREDNERSNGNPKTTQPASGGHE